jgi:hypothetical protein
LPLSLVRRGESPSHLSPLLYNLPAVGRGEGLGEVNNSSIPFFFFVLAYRLSLKAEGCSFYVPEPDLPIEKLFKKN